MMIFTWLTIALLAIWMSKVSSCYCQAKAGPVSWTNSTFHFSNFHLQPILLAYINQFQLFKSNLGYSIFRHSVSVLNSEYDTFGIWTQVSNAGNTSSWIFNKHPCGNFLWHYFYISLKFWQYFLQYLLWYFNISAIFFTFSNFSAFVRICMCANFNLDFFSNIFS